MARLLRPHKVIRTDTNRSATYDFLSVTMGLSRTVSEINGNYFVENRKIFPPHSVLNTPAEVSLERNFVTAFRLRKDVSN